MLGFPVGSAVPVGFFDRTKGGWQAEKDGRVVSILAVNGGLAELDVAGLGVAASAGDLAALGVTDAERAELSVQYAPGQTLWRVALMHFSPVDYNWSRFPAPTNTVAAATVAAPLQEDPCKVGGSVI